MTEKKQGIPFFIYLCVEPEALYCPSEEFMFILQIFSLQEGPLWDRGFQADCKTGKGEERLRRRRGGLGKNIKLKKNDYDDEDDNDNGDEEKEKEEEKEEYYKVGTYTLRPISVYQY